MRMKLEADEVEDLRRFLDTNAALLGRNSPGMILERAEDDSPLEMKLIGIGSVLVKDA